MDEGIYSRPAGRRAGTDLVMMLHGYGSNPERMTGWFDELPPDAVLEGPVGRAIDRSLFRGLFGG